MLIGIHGKLGSGKDTVFERLRDAGDLVPATFTVERRSFADKLKDSACALLGITREQMEEMKRSDATEIEVHTHHEGGMASVQSRMNMRTFLQRYGTEAHRDIFGDNFWVQQAMTDMLDPAKIYVFTDVRFENEARAIRDLGGTVWRVTGPDEDTGDHASERPLPDDMVDATIDNTVREEVLVGYRTTGYGGAEHGVYGPDFSHLDAEIRRVLSELMTAQVPPDPAASVHGN